MQTLSVVDEIVAGVRAESAVWAASLREEPEWQAVFSPLAPARFGVGLETVYEAYLTHYGRPRLFAPPDGDEAVLLGDYLYAHGLVRIADAGGVTAVSVMSELITRCSSLRADHAPGDGDAWVDAACALGGTPAPDEIERALAAHSDRVST